MAIGRGRERIEIQGVEFKEKVVHINRVAKVVKGGRRFSFGALVVVGDYNGRVGYGLGKAKEVPEAIRKPSRRRRSLWSTVPIVRRDDPVRGGRSFGAGHVLLRPAGEGTGVIAGGGVRAVVELAGVRNVLTKCIGSNNPHNMVKATVAALPELQTRRGNRGAARQESRRNKRVRRQ